jgi:hypothetical protein
MKRGSGSEAMMLKTYGSSLAHKTGRSGWSGSPDRDVPTAPKGASYFGASYMPVTKPGTSLRFSKSTENLREHASLAGF